MTDDLDAGVGMVLDCIDSLGVADTTYVVFMSDNGAASPPRRSAENQPLSGGKASFWEGGIRVPLIVRGPGVAPNSFCYETVVGYDLFPTFCNLAGVPSGRVSSVEGTDLKPLLMGAASGEFQRVRDEVVFHFPHYAKGPGQTPQSAILAGNFKLIRFLETNESRLFDIARDIGEQIDLTSQSPDTSAELSEHLDEYLVEVGAQLPRPNPDYQPTTDTMARERLRGKVPPRIRRILRRER